MQVKEMMSRELVTIGPKESCLDAVVRMQRRASGTSRW